MAGYEEKQYIELIEEILKYGVLREDRTETGTLSVFGRQHRYKLGGTGGEYTIPLFTSKRVFWKAVKEELLWFIKGSTNSKELSEKGVKIWDGNSSREFLDKRGLNYPEGELGPIYGYQWRHWGKSSTTLGVDQLKYCIHLIRTDPTSRRIIMSAWNVSDLDKMALPPCHVMCQFYVHDKKLSCMLYQRSCDMGLGVPFNVASYSLLTILIAHICDLEPYELIHSMGDAHVYLNHVDALKEQITLPLHAFPTVKITTKTDDIDKITSEDIILCNYMCNKSIPMKMAV